MKIGLVCPYNIFRGGGVQEHVLAQAAELRKRGHKVKIITPRPRKHNDAPGEDIIFIGNSTSVRTPIKTTLELGINLNNDNLTEVLENEDFDVLHIHEPEVPVLGAQIVAQAQCPVVATFHALYPETPLARTIETFRIPYSRSIFTKLSIMTAVSDVAAQFVRERTGQEVAIIPNGVNLTKYHPASKKTASDTQTVLYIGRLEKRKGVMYLLKAFAELTNQRTNVRLIIAGDGDLRNGLESYVQDNAIENVHFLGFVSETDKLRLLSEADVFCSPALFGESFGIVLLEAMACGVPTVAGDNAGYATVMTGTGRVSLVNPKETNDFARRLGLLLEDEGIRKLWREWAAKAIKQYDYPVIVDHYEALYKKL